MPAFQTRIATLPDLPAVATLFDAYRQFYEQASDLPMATRFIGERMRDNESIIILVQDDAGQVIGFCQIYPSFCSIEAKPIYTLSDLFVAPRGRQRGAGRALLQAAEAHAARHGMARMDLTTAKTNRQAQTLYESLGWVRDEVYHAYSRRVAC